MRKKPYFASSAALVVVATLIVVALLGGSAGSARADTHDDAVLDWNLYAAQALINAPATANPPGNPPGVGQPPPVSVLHLAIVQGAVYDAVNMIDGGREPYLDGLPDAPSHASSGGSRRDCRARRARWDRHHATVDSDDPFSASSTAARRRSQWRQRRMETRQ